MALSISTMTFIFFYCLLLVLCFTTSKEVDEDPPLPNERKEGRKILKKSPVRKKWGLHFGNLSNAQPGDPCVLELYQKWSPLAQPHFYDDLEDFNAAFESFVEQLKGKMTNFGEDDVCFHKSMFMECESVKEICTCAKEGKWKSHRFIERDRQCLVGLWGRCNPKIPALKCDTNLTCVKADRKFKNSVYVCSSAISLIVTDCCCILILILLLTIIKVINKGF